jgi:hypothetical protein
LDRYVVFLYSRQVKKLICFAWKKKYCWHHCPFRSLTNMSFPPNMWYPFSIDLCFQEQLGEIGPNLHTRSLVLYVCFVDRCLSFCILTFGRCVVSSSSIYGFWLPRWYLQTLLIRLTLCKLCINLTLLHTTVCHGYE